VKCKQNNKLSNCAARISVAFLLFSISNYTLRVVPLKNAIKRSETIEIYTKGIRQKKFISRNVQENKM